MVSNLTISFSFADPQHDFAFARSETEFCQMQGVDFKGIRE